MVKPALSTALAAVAIATAANINVQAFQSSRPVALPASAVTRSAPFATSMNRNQPRRSTASISMSAGSSSSRDEASPSSPRSANSLFRSTSQRSRRALQKMRRSFAVLLASVAFFLSSTRVLPTPPAHAASTAAATASSTSLVQRLNPFRTRSADEMIDAYVRDRLFADDAYDPVESAYREACADAGAGGKDAAEGAYPTLLAETAGTALGKQTSVSSLLSSSTSRSAGPLASSSAGAAARGSGSAEKNDGITAVIMKASDFLQARLKVSASVSYYLLAGSSLVGVCVVPGLVGVVYTGLQRLQIDKSEMKMYGKIADMDATSKKVTDDDDDDDEEE